MQFISRELRPFWKAVCTVSLRCNKNFNVEYYTRLNQFFPPRKLDALFLSSCSKHFCIFCEAPILYSHNMLISQGMHITELGRVRIFIERRNMKRITICRNCLTDRNLHFECPSVVAWWLCPKAHTAAVQRQLGKCERISPQSDLLREYQNADLSNCITTFDKTHQYFHVIS